MTLCSVILRSEATKNLEKGVSAMLPSDPVILLSFINTKLRDEYKSLDDLCAALGADRDEICRTLSEAGFKYDERSNSFGSF